MADDVQIELPDDVLDFLSDVGAVEFAQDFVKKYNLGEKDVADVMNLVEDVTRSDIKLDQLPIELSKQFKLDAVIAKKAAIEIAEERLLPVQEVVGDVRGQVAVWGGDLSVLPQTKDLSVSPESFVHSFTLSLPGDMPEYLQNRLQHFLLMYLMQPAKRNVVIEDMMRAEKVGGLGFEKKDAGTLLSYFDEKKADVSFKKEIGGVEMKEVGSREVEKREVQQEVKIESIAVDSLPKIIEVKKSVEQKPIATISLEESKPVDFIELIETTKILPKKVVQNIPAVITEEKIASVVELPRNDKLSKPDAFTETDAQEIEEIKIKKQSALEKSPDAPVTIDEMIAQVCSIDSLSFSDQKLGDRCKQIVESRFHEVRNASDTQNLLERSVESGGLGVTGRKLSDMMQAIEHGFDEFQQLFAKKVEDDRKGFVGAQAERELEKQTLAEKEQKAMTKRYIEMTGKIPDSHEMPVDPNGTRVSASVSAEEAIKMREQKIDTGKVRSVIEAAKPSVSSEIIAQRPLVARPAMEDVRFTRRLSGPIDELRTMTLVDFRRSGRDAASSIEKIQNQVDLVEDQGYEKKVEAIRAWQSSPLYQMYLSIARTSMQEGKPFEEVRHNQEVLGSDVLTKEELSAILQLNSKLRF